MKHASLFSGIGGFDLAAQWMGWNNVFHCEWNPFCQKVLKHYWPDAVSYGDITQTDFTIWRGKVDILTGGFPCQPYSVAGKRKGTEDDRHLWPEMLRAIREIKPPWVVGENVPGLLSWSEGVVFEQVCAEMEAEGYEVQTVVLPACGVDAPHRRDRVWIIAHSKHIGLNGSEVGQFMGKGMHSNQTRKNAAIKSERCSTQESRTTKNTIGIRRNGSESKNESSKRRQRKSCTGDDVRLQDVTDTESKRLEGHNERNRCALNRSDKRIQLGAENKQSIADTECIRQQRQGRTFDAFGTKESENWKASWSYDDGRWPTQSPLCGRNDGLPSRLVGITVSKHRIESIKGYGNSIIPQVVYEIFKAIEQTENEFSLTLSK